MPAIREEDLPEFQSEILFLLIGENPLPNYVAAKLLTKTKKLFSSENPILYLVHSEDTKNYADNLEKVLNPDKDNPNFKCIPFPINPWEYFNIESEINRRLAKVLAIAKEKNLNPSIGLNYTGGTKAMSVHAYRAIKAKCEFGKFSYLDANSKYMRFDETTVGEGETWIDISDVNSKAFEMTKITLDQLLDLHGWTKKKSPSVSIQLLEENLTVENIENADEDKNKLFEDFVLNTVLSLKEQCKLDSICANLEIANPYVETDEIYCEIDVLAIRGYQLFAISCTTAQTDFQEIRDSVYPSCVENSDKERMKKIFKRLRDDNKHILTHKLFEIAHRAGQLGGAESQIGFISFADNIFTGNLENKLKKEKIKVWGKSDLRNLNSKLRNWFNGR